MNLNHQLIIFLANYLLVVEVIFALAIGLLIIKKRERMHFMIVIVLGALLALLIAHIASLVYNDPRPFVQMHKLPLVAHGVDNGFPSDHTLLASFLASVITLKSLKLGLIAWIMAFSIGLGRVLALVHHPIDIMGAIMISIFSVLVANILSKHLIVKFNQ